MEQTSNYYKIRAIGDTISDTGEFIKTHFRSLIKSFFIIAGPLIFIAAILFGVFQQNTFSLAQKVGGGATDAADAYSLGLSFFQYGFTSILLFLVSFFLVVAVVYQYMMLAQTNAAADITVNMVWKAVRKNMWLIIKTTIGLIICYIGICIGFIFIAAIAGGIAGGIGAGIASAVSGVGAVAAAIVGAILVVAAILGFVAFGFYMFSPLAIVFSIRVFEHKRFWKSVSRSYELIKNNRWNTVGVLLLTLVVQSSIQFVFYIPSMVYMIYQLNSLDLPKISWLFVISSGVSMLVGYLVMMISMIAINFHYFNLVERQESVSLLNKVQSFEPGQQGQGEVANETY